ncbi:hypothetical protein [Hespellia stercorisuis]|uniref:Uncharacterized protein n=1 Tax=Hespellia stercorisuis DSM 15480 TaxID=1121950 RepID=A0A1M6WG06_9FIRM|nr:hypothetical protein [Hespellia stercorisuis]SHK92722.1 hypothetical protein SAMN02745243_04011 [Hespellia stercorisuis DSM 15480]
MVKKGAEILQNIQNIGENNPLPNFYLSGSSISQIEKLGFRIIEWIESKNRLCFQGIVKHFCIKMS